MTSLRDLAAAVVSAHDRRLEGEASMVAYELAIEQLRAVIELGAIPLELQAMHHVSSVLGSLGSSAARARALLVVALAMAPDAFTEQQYSELVRRAKG